MEVVGQGQEIPTAHFLDQLQARSVSMLDVRYALAHPSRIEEYPGMPQHGGSCWRAHGHDVDNTIEVAVGVELFRDDAGRQVVLCTVLPPREK